MTFRLLIEFIVLCVFVCDCIDESTHWGLVMPYGVLNFDSIGSDNGLVTNRTKALPDRRLNYQYVKPETREVNIGSGNGLVLSSIRPLSWADIDPDLCRHIASLGHKELS